MKIIATFLLILACSVEAICFTCTGFIAPEITDSQILGTAGDAEDLIVKLSELYSIHPEFSESISEVIFSINIGMENILSFDASNPQNIVAYYAFQRRIARVKSNPINIITRTTSIKTSSLPKTTKSLRNTANWSDVITNPEKIKAEEVYNVLRTDGSQIKVVFSQKIVSKALGSKDDFIRTSVLKSLRALESAGSDSTNGLIRLLGDKSIFEIKFFGKTGNFRFFAYLNDGVFNVVHWSKDSKHSTSTIRRSIESTVSARNNRGH